VFIHTKPEVDVSITEQIRQNRENFFRFASEQEVTSEFCILANILILGAQKILSSKELTLGKKFSPGLPKHEEGQQWVFALLQSCSDYTNQFLPLYDVYSFLISKLSVCISDSVEDQIRLIDCVLHNPKTLESAQNGFRQTRDSFFRLLSYCLSKSNDYPAEVIDQLLMQFNVKSWLASYPHEDMVNEVFLALLPHLEESGSAVYLAAFRICQGLFKECSSQVFWYHSRDAFDLIFV
jgi:hypothetical protein